MEMNRIRPAGMIMLFEVLFLFFALLLSLKQISWIEWFSNLFLISLFSLAILIGLMLFGSRTLRQLGISEFTFIQMKWDNAQPVMVALWLATVIAFFASMISALMLMN